jgi:predicted house-cleaning NTP pyrophosphatase (Maf/HAM1 superfamily)
MRMKNFVVVVLTVIFAIQGFAQDTTFTPVNLRLVRATYKKITIKWQAGSSATQAVSYKVLRDNTEIGTSTTTEYADDSLQTGTEYKYKVIAVSSGGENSPESTELKVKTIKSVTFDDSDKVEQIVDQLHSTTPTTSTALVLISAVKSGFESLLSTTVSFNIIDGDILNDFVNEELLLIQEVTPELTEVEQVAAQAELDNLMTNSFGGNSFEHVYIHSKLIELAEKHWQKGHKTAATTLYEFSLKYLSDQEAYVFSTLARLARFKLEEITETSTNAEIATILHAHRDTHNRFFDFFENSTSHQAQYAHTMPSIEYFKRFSTLLEYSVYDQTVFTSAQQAAQAAIDILDDERSQKTYEKIDAWELINQKIVYKDSAGVPISGTITVKNITANTEKKYYFANSEEAFVDERQFTVSNGEIIVPGYKGHIYETLFSFNVEGGNPITFTTTGVPVAKGKVATYDNLGSPVLTDGAADGSESIFVLDRPTYPYNLSYEPAIDVFTLKWDWVNSESFTATHFKVFRGPTEIANVTTQSATNIPLDSPDGISTYTVLAYDAAGNASKSSQTITILPGDQTPYAAYFTWMETHFGEQLMYSCDDPDGDGVNNYQEFINGTDPTRIPGPIPYLQQKTYTKITLQWDAMFTGEAGVSYKVFRNDVEVGTATTNSFTDTNLTPGLTFAYKVKAVQQGDLGSDFGVPASFTTMKPETSEYAANLQQIVDQFNPIDATQYTGASLVSAVKSGLEALVGTNITFTVIDNSILEGFVEEELTLIREISPSMTAAERLTAQTELKDMLNNSYGGNSFEHVYIHSKLVELGEKHWQKGNKTAAKALYECSLGYLKDQETYVFNSLSRLARFEFEEITETSTNAEIITALNKQRDIYLRFFDFFENSTSMQATYAYHMSAVQYFNRFPVLLKYEDYNQDVFNTALQLTQAAYALNDDSMHEKRRDNIAAWELMNLVVSITKPDGTPAAGTLTLKNVSDKLFYNREENIPETREFRIDGSTVTIPVYVGHKYDLTASFDVVGGPAIKYTIEALPHEKGKKTIYDPYSATVTQDLAEGETNGELVFIADQPQTPYNLSAATLPDVFTLTWDWVAPTANYQLQHFKVFCGGTEIGTVTQQQMDNIPRAMGVNSPYTYTVVAVDVNNVSTDSSPVLTVLPVFAEEEEAYFAWKTKYFGDATIFANADTDQDGLTNWQEFLLGSNPTVAPVADPKETLTNITPGIKVSYYDGSFSSIPDFSTKTPFKTDVLTSFNMPTNYGNILTSGKEDAVAMVLTAYFDATVAGKYRFYMVDDDSARLYIDNNLVIDHNASGWRSGYADLYLKAGTHSFKLEYCEKIDRAVLQLFWAGPDFTQKVMDSSALWYTTDDETVLAEVMAWQKDTDLDGVRDIEEYTNNTSTTSSDSDNDGLSDYEEIYTYKTDPNKADTDGDGVSDFEEVKVAFTDPLKAEFDGTSTTLQTLTGSSFVSSSAGWEKEGDAVYCAARNGSITYNLTIPAKGTYVLEVSGNEYNSFASSGTFSIDLYINDQICGSRELKIVDSQPDTVRFFLPELAAGTATAKLVWNNISSDTYLKINSLAVKSLGGVDADANGTADWIDSRLENMCEVVIPTSSKTSPLCIEGQNGSFLNSINITIDGIPTANANENSWKLPWTDGTVIQWLSPNTPPTQLEGLTAVVSKAARGARNTWYADIPLYPGGCNGNGGNGNGNGNGGNGNGNGNSGGFTTITVSMQDGAKTVTQNVSWTPTNIFVDEDMTIRAGDSLLLTAPGAANVTGSVNITVNGESFATDEDGKIPYEFENPGSFTVSATLTPDNGDPAVNGDITIKVVAASFAGAPFAIVGLDRNWTNPQIPAEAALDYDDSMTVFRAIQTDGSSIIAFSGKNPGDAYITARLGKDGPVMAAAKINIIDLQTSKSDGYYTIIDTFSDGSTMIEVKISMTVVPEDLRVEIRAYGAGTSFLDGTIVKWFTAEDFDENGVLRYRMLKSPEASTSLCHGIYFYDGDSFVNNSWN